MLLLWSPDISATAGLSRIYSYKNLRPYANEGISRQKRRKAGLGSEIL